MRKNIYKWHRTLSLIIAIPVMLWAMSGFMHPIMTNIRPKVGMQFIQPLPADTSQIKISLREALQKNNIPAIGNMRIVQMGGNQFYQLQLPDQPMLQYISTQNGRLLKNGDNLYARWLAKKFLEGKKDPPATGKLFASLNNNITPQDKEEVDLHDCCTNTTAAIMYDTSGAFVKSIELVEKFTDEYKYINRLLPVYKVSFNRADGIRIYVETGQDRFAFAMDNKRAAFDRVFTLFHTLGWLDFFGKGKHVFAIIITLMAFLTTLMGIYIFAVTKTKKPNGNEIVKARRNHRWVSVIISLFTLMFTGSGAFHAFKKLDTDTVDTYTSKQVMATEKISLDIPALQKSVGNNPVTNISLVSMGEELYWQVYTLSKRSNNYVALTASSFSGPAIPIEPPFYINARDYSNLADGDKLYAQYLACLYGQHKTSEIKATTRIEKFTDEYGFVNKRLPVWKIDYASNSNERFYIETSTGKVAARINNKDMMEGYSFALFHKHEFMAWAGKPVKDFSTMFWATAQIAVIIVGLILYFKIRRRGKKAN